MIISCQVILLVYYCMFQLHATYGTQQTMGCTPQPRIAKNSAEFPQQAIRLNYGVFWSDNLKFAV